MKKRMIDGLSFRAAKGLVSHLKISGEFKDIDLRLYAEQISYISAEELCSIQGMGFETYHEIQKWLFDNGIERKWDTGFCYASGKRERLDGLSIRAVKAIAACLKIANTEDIDFRTCISLIESIPRNDFLRLPNIGVGTLDEIHIWLAQFGIVSKFGRPDPHKKIVERPPIPNSINAAINLLKSRGFSVVPTLDCKYDC